MRLSDTKFVTVSNYGTTVTVYAYFKNVDPNETIEVQDKITDKFSFFIFRDLIGQKCYSLSSLYVLLANGLQ